MELLTRPGTNPSVPLAKTQYPRLGEPLPQRVLVMRALQLGDLLCAVPAFRALRSALPTAKIVLVGLPWAKTFVERFDRYLDGFIEFPGYPGLPERSLDSAKAQLTQIHKIPQFFQAAQAQQFDLAIQMHGSGTLTNPLTVMLGARLNAGFYAPEGYCPDRDRFLPYPEQDSEVWRLLRLMEFLGIPLQGDELEFPVQEADRRSLTLIPEVSRLNDREYVCVHPGSRSRHRRWSPEQFAQVADALATQGLQVVLTGSTEEMGLTQAVAQAMKAPTLNLAGKTSLGALAALLNRARLLVCNDTGVSHVATGLRVPSVVIFTGSEPQRWAPRDRQLHRIIQPKLGMTAQTAIAQALDLLNQRAHHVA